MTPKKLWNRSSTYLTNIAVARHVLSVRTEKNITKMYIIL